MKFSTIPLLLALIGSPLSGQIIWKAAGSNSDFNAKQSWHQGGGFQSPGPGVNAIFGTTVTATSTQPEVTADITTDSIELQGTSAVTLTTTGNTLTLETGMTIASGSSLDFNGSLAGTGIGTLDLNVEGTATFAGSITHNSTSSSTILLSGSGETTLSGATVAGSLTVGLDSTLKGSGTVTGAFASNGTLSPGENGAGTINVDGAMTSTGTWLFDAVDASTRDFVDAGANIVITNTELVLSGPISTANGPILIANSVAGIVGTFDNVTGLQPGQSINYSGNQITITGTAIIPEVTHIVPLSLAFFPLLTMRNRRSKEKDSLFRH